MKKVLIIFVSILLLWTVIGMTDHRLPKSVIPYFYNITTDIHPDKFWFRGIIEIHAEVVEETDNITLHGVELTIVTLSVHFGEIEMYILDYNFHEDFQFFVIKFRRKLRVGNYKIEISYQGNLNRNLRGLYATNFTRLNEYPRTVAVTNFETMDARRAFPCFEEPALKANFSISVVRDTEHISLSNMPLLKSTIFENGRICDTFETTPKMSTYLVAFAVCEFERMSYPRGYIYTRPSNVEEVTYVASITNPIIGEVENYLDVKLSLKKLDMIVVSHMSEGGGLENWGLILLSEKRAYYERGVNAQWENQDIGTLIAHECVHQWFGNLVTLAWWNDLWLNEGIVTFVHFTILEKLIPDWRLKEQSTLYCLITAVELDCLENARSISEKANEPSDYEHYFDNISYKKSAAVLQILESVVGKAIFRHGLQIFIENHKYSTATGRDLWNAFQMSLDKVVEPYAFPIGLDVATVMESWEKQAGIPVLNVTRNYSVQSIAFSQERYLLQKTKNLTTEWYIPINIATKSQPDFKNFTPLAWLESKKHLILNHHINQGDWWILLSITTLIFTTQALRSPPRIDGVASIEPREDSSYYRLPENVIPSEYILLLETFLLNDTFKGDVVIKVDVVEETDTITFHAAKIEFIETVVTDSSGTQVTIERQEDNEDRDFRVLYFGSTLPVGEYTISISYNGILTGHKDGFYRRMYTNSNNEFVRLATTQFEATSARYAFPCFDEPALKARFTISIIRDANYNSISNMPLKYSTDLSEDRVLDAFETTPVMPTYLVAFVVSDFKYVEDGNHRVYARPDYISNGYGAFALQVGSPILEALEQYTKVPYSLEKMYQIALPLFSVVAMENWGLVTYRETALMYSKSTTTTAAKQYIELVISHEFVHQWFGNLVGPKWWSYLWLNEGFASFLQYEIGGKVKPQWRLSEQLIVANSQSALSVDAVATVRPMTYDAGSPREISKLFDTIAYGKAGAVLRMLQHAIGEEAFREGLRIYLTEMAYKAATGDDLWNAIQTAVEANYTNALPEGYTIPEIMSTWEFQGGIPLVTVTRNYTNGRVAFSQKRFILSDPNSALTTTWYVPINYATARNLNFEDTTVTNWIVPDSDLVLNLNINADDFLIINKQFSGYYRTTYDEENWNLIANYLDTDNFEQIPPLTRAVLLNDAFVLARANRVRYGIALNLAKYLHRETDYIPLKSLFNELGNFNEMFRGLDNYYLLEARFAESFEAAVNELGAVENEDVTDDEEHLNILNRIQVIQWACLFGNQLCRKLTTERLNDPSAISLDLKSTVLCAGLRGANATVWNYIYERSLVEEDSTLKSSLTSALGCSENEEILNSYVEQALAKQTSVFSDIYSQGNNGIRYTLNYINNNLSKIYEALGTTATGSLIKSLASYLRSPSQLAQLQELNRTNTIEELVADLVTAITTVERYVATTAPFNEEVESWINIELGSNDNDDDDDDDGGNDDDDDDGGNDGDGDDEGSGEGSDNGSNAKIVALPVSLITLVIQCFLL